jgi:hypothetical protein
MICFTFPSGNKYVWSPRAFAYRLMGLLDARNLTSLASAQTALNNMAFTAGGWTTIKKVIAELVLGSIAFPNELDTAGTTLVGVTEAQLGTRDVSSPIT